MQKQHGELDVASLPSRNASATACSPLHPVSRVSMLSPAPHEFLVDRLEVHHEPAVDPAQQDHDHR